MHLPLCLIAGSLAAAQALALTQIADPLFRDLSFEDWASGGQQSHIRWMPTVSPAQLSVQQRLRVRIRIGLDGGDIEKRGREGRVLLLIQLRDSEGRTYQTHDEMDPGDYPGRGRRNDFIYSQDILILPGKYRVSLGMFDTTTKKHRVMHMRLKVPSLANDPFPDSWRDLPVVAFVPETEPLDAWFQPMLNGPLNLPLETSRPVRIDLVMNLSPSEQEKETFRTSRQISSALIPALKVISQVDVRDGSLNVSVLDLERRRAIFEQHAVHALDWPRLRASLVALDPGRIDRPSLATRDRNAQFFLTQVERGIASADVLVVLSSPLAFLRGEDLHPIHPGQNQSCRIFYIRYDPLPSRILQIGPVGGGRGDPGFIGPTRLRVARPDQLERTLKPLKPRVFDVSNPVEFRAALGAILREIGRL